MDLMEKVRTQYLLIEKEEVAIHIDIIVQIL
jgi:hypothetical protein